MTDTKGFSTVLYFLRVRNRAHIKLFNFENIFLKIEKIVNIFSNQEKIFLKIDNLNHIWYIYLKIKNYCLKIFLKIHVNKKVYQNTYSII